MLVDTDGDGIVDNFDNDTFGGGYSPILQDGELLLRAGLPDSDGDNIPDHLQSNLPAAAAAEGAILTGLAGRGGCSIALAGSKGPLDPLLAIMAVSALCGLRLRRRSKSGASVA